MRPTPPVIADLFKRYRPTVFFAVPAVFRALIEYARQGNKLETGQLRFCVSAGEVLPVEFAGPQITVGFNAQYLNEFFNVIQDGQVAFEFKDGNSQAQIRPEEDGDYDFRYVVMPMRL